MFFLGCFNSRRKLVGYIVISQISHIGIRTANYSGGGLGGVIRSILLREDPSVDSPMLICDRIILILRSSSSVRLLWFELLSTLLHTLPTGDVGILILLLGLYRIFLLELLRKLLLLALLRTLLLRKLLLLKLLLRDNWLRKLPLLLRILLVRTLWLRDSWLRKLPLLLR